MSFNTFGRLFRVTTWGESHGPEIGCVIDGCPPGIALSPADIQIWLEKRRPGQSRYTTQRQEPDAVEIASGVFEGRTTGTPIALRIANLDARSKDYERLAGAYRPGHADYVYDLKYGVRDHRGGGRSSARETAARVGAGAVARRVIEHVLGAGVKIRAALVELGGLEINLSAWDWDEVARNPFFAPDAETADRWGELVDAARKRGSSLGAIVETHAEGVPAGLGAPIYGKLDADLAGALMSINAVKGVEIGDGFAAARADGTQASDEMRRGPDGKPLFLSNHAGGILGGISTGQTLVARMALKPTSSIPTPRRTITKTGEETDIATFGRHDPCVGIRAAPVAEAMVACVLADHALLARGQGAPP